jgi:DNA polymerase-3 subunit delta'
MLIGREAEKEILSRLKNKGLLAGSFLFFGDGQVGKLALAEELTAELEGNPAVCGERMVVSPGESKIGISEIREVKKFLKFRPVMSEFRSVIISSADDMTPEAQNAALKIVEEPPSYALIIFIAKGTESLLPTLVSRLRRIYFPRVEESAIALWLKEKGCDGEEASRLAKLSFGRPGFALELLGKKAKESYSAGRLPEIPKKFESPGEYGEFMKISLGLLYNDKNRNYPLLKKVLRRMELSSKFNTNKKLQLQSIPWTR